MVERRNRRTVLVLHFEDQALVGRLLIVIDISSVNGVKDEEVRSSSHEEEVWYDYVSEHVTRGLRTRNDENSPLDCSPRLSETPIEDPEEELERYKLEAKQACDTLIQMGRRPDSPDPTNTALDNSPCRWRALVPIR